MKKQVEDLYFLTTILKTGMSWKEWEQEQVNNFLDKVNKGE